jgi:hypothetical protein
VSNLILDCIVVEKVAEKEATIKNSYRLRTGMGDEFIIVADELPVNTPIRITGHIDNYISDGILKSAVIHDETLEECIELTPFSKNELIVVGKVQYIQQVSRNNYSGIRRYMMIVVNTIEYEEYYDSLHIIGTFDTQEQLDIAHGETYEFHGKLAGDYKASTNYMDYSMAFSDVKLLANKVS